MPDRRDVIPHEFDRSTMAERGRRGGLQKAANARPVGVTLTSGELAALDSAYRLLADISRRAKASTATPPDPTDQAA